MPARHAGGALRFGHLPAGVLLTLSNPYWSLWWASLGAAYIARVTTLYPFPLAIGGLALAHWLTDLGWLGGLSLVTGSGRGLIGQRGYRIVMFLCGLFLLCFAFYFAWSGLGFLLGR